MNKAEKLKHLIALAKESNQKCFSELTDEQKYAVMFLSDYRPARWEANKIKYDRNSSKVVLAGSYVETNKALKSLDPDAKGINASSILVLIDEVLPAYEETDFLTALVSDDKIPRKKGEFAHLPELEKQKPSLNKEETYRGIGMTIASLHVAITKGLELTPTEKAIHYAIHRDKETFKSLCSSLGLPSTTIINLEPEYERYVRGTLSYEETGSAASYLATYIYFASLGIKLKAKVKE